MSTYHRRLSVLLVVSALAFGGSSAAAPLHGAAAGTAQALDLQSAIRLALAQPRLRAAGHEAAASEAAIDQAGRYPNPTLEYLREGEQAGTRTTTIQINQPIELGGKRRARVALAEGEAALARSDLAALRQEVRAEVIAAFYGVLAARERQELASQLAALAERSVDVAARQVAAGKVPPIDATRARLAALEARTELNTAGAELALARTRLGALVGRPGDALELATQSDEALPRLAPLPVLLARAAEAAPVRRARAALAAQDAQAQVERAARVPDVTLSVGSQRADEVGRRQAVLGLSVPLPLFDRNSGRLGAALRRTDKAREELAAAETAAAAELGAAHVRFQVASQEAALLREEAIPDARSSHALTLKGFEHGKFGLLDVLDAQRTLAQVQARQWNAQLAAWQAYADIARLAGAATDNEQTNKTED
ncbi:TolC family protein [Massilia haematophila]|uniref:TolC family protein n=2 Tax=Massilia TaxID=149698 RepID=A0ABV7PFY6_9BURK